LSTKAGERRYLWFIEIRSSELKVVVLISSTLQKIKDLIRRLALLNNKMTPTEGGIPSVSAYTSIGSVVNRYNADVFKVVAPFLPDALKMEELIVRHLETMRGKGVIVIRGVEKTK
jgi:hypothetical protein